MVASEPLEDRLIEILEESELIDEGLPAKVYHKYRILAAAEFANEIRKYNWEILKNPPLITIKIYKNNWKGKLKKYCDSVIEPATDFVAEKLKRPLCYTTLINPFFYSLFALRYSKENKGHVL